MERQQNHPDSESLDSWQSLGMEVGKLSAEISGLRAAINQLVEVFKESKLPSSISSRSIPENIGDSPRWLTVIETSDALKVTDTYIRRLVREGRLVGEHRGRQVFVEPQSAASFQRSRPGRKPR